MGLDKPVIKAYQDLDPLMGESPSHWLDQPGEHPEGNAQVEQEIHELEDFQLDGQKSPIHTSVMETCQYTFLRSGGKPSSWTQGEMDVGYCQYSKPEELDEPAEVAEIHH